MHLVYASIVFAKIPFVLLEFGQGSDGLAALERSNHKKCDCLISCLPRRNT